MSEQAIRINSEMVAEIKELKAKLREYEDERVNSSEIFLTLGIGAFTQKVYASWDARFERLGDIRANESTARSAASRQCKGTEEVPTVIAFTLCPVGLTEKQGRKWPQKPRKKLKR